MVEFQPDSGQQCQDDYEVPTSKCASGRPIIIGCWVIYIFSETEELQAARAPGSRVRPTMAACTLYRESRAGNGLNT